MVLNVDLPNEQAPTSAAWKLRVWGLVATHRLEWCLTGEEFVWPVNAGVTCQCCSFPLVPCLFCCLGPWGAALAVLGWLRMALAAVFVVSGVEGR